VEVTVNPDRLAAARALQPICERQLLGRSVLLFEHRDQQELTPFGEAHTPSIADLFIALMGGTMSAPSLNDARSNLQQGVAR